MTTTERVPRSPAPSPTFETIGDRITKARKIAGIDIKELHERTGINRNSLGQYEADKVNPRPYMLKAIAMACRVSHDWLATGHGHPFDGTDRPSEVPISGSG